MRGIEDMQGYRNGYGKPRRLTMRSRTVTVRRPRVRDLDERFESRLLPLFTRRTQEVRGLLPELYLHGLASGDFELALRGLLGEQAPLSASTVARAKERWQAEYSEWQQRRIEDEIVYLWLDGVYLKAGLEKEKAALLVAIGVKADGHKVVLAVSSGYRESTASWSGLLRDLNVSDETLCPLRIVPNICSNFSCSYAFYLLAIIVRTETCLRRLQRLLSAMVTWPQCL